MGPSLPFIHETLSVNWLKQLLELISEFVKVVRYKDGVQKSIVLKYFSNKIFKNYSHFLKICPHTNPQSFVDINWQHCAILLVCIILLTFFYLTLWALLDFSLVTGLQARRRKIKLGTRRIPSTL